MSVKCSHFIEEQKSLRQFDGHTIITENMKKNTTMVILTFELIIMYDFLCIENYLRSSKMC